MIQSSPTVFSFFSGAGFLDLGFELSGYNVAFVNEVFSPFIDLYRHSRKELNFSSVEYGYHNFSIEEYLKNPKKTELKELVQHARTSNPIIGFVGGPPCPDFSIGGKNRGREGDNGKLSNVFCEIICQQQPDFFVFENVKGLWRTKKHREFYEELKKKLSDSGYLITEKLVNSIEYGVPQYRERILMIGFLSNLIPDIKLKNKGYQLNFPWEKYKKFSSKEIFDIHWPTVDKFEEDSVLICNKNIVEELTVNYWFKKNNVLNHPNSKHHFQPRAGIKRFSVIQEGDDSKKSFKRLHRWRYSPTACYGNNEVHLHPYKVRRISVSEALAIQSMPSNFSFPDDATLTNMFKSIGNGVPYLLSLEIAKTINLFIATIASSTNKSIWRIDKDDRQIEINLALI